MVADRYTDLKQKHGEMQQRCARQNSGFAPLVMESTRGLAGETATLLQSLAKLVDSRENLPSGQTWQQLQERISVDLHRGFHGACPPLPLPRFWRPFPCVFSCDLSIGALYHFNPLHLHAGRRAAEQCMVRAAFC